jgi:hypothetical protein
MVSLLPFAADERSLSSWKVAVTERFLISDPKPPETSPVEIVGVDDDMSGLEKLRFG